MIILPGASASLGAMTAVRSAQLTTQMAMMSASRPRFQSSGCMRFADGGGWRSGDTAPRDGTIVEIRNEYGVAPTYSLSKWVEGREWQHVNDESRGTSDGSHISWRPYEGDPSAYVDPTGGAQDSLEYWDEAIIQRTGGLLNPAAIRAENERKSRRQETASDAFDEGDAALAGMIMGLLVAGGLILLAVLS